MAIVFEQPKKPFNWSRFLFVIFIIAFLVFGTYYLFFAPSPRLDVVLPPPLEKARQISTLEFVDPASVLGSPAFRRLKSYVGQPGIGSLGRVNPFIRP